MEKEAEWNLDGTCVVERTGLGKCLAAKENLKTHQVVGEFSPRFGTMAHKPSMHSVQLDESRHLESSSIARYTAHSANFNAVMRGMQLVEGVPRLVDDTVEAEAIDGLCLVLIKDVSAGELITFDYRTSEWEMAAPFFDEEEGKEISGFSKCTPEEKAKLRPYITPFIRSKL